LPLLAIAQALTACSAFIGNDSGITHLAAAVGARVVALYGPTDPALWGPRGTDVRVLSAANRRLESIDIAAVEDATRAALQQRCRSLTERGVE
jgi:ADP-heptose:LPS heptosyltransferase